MVPKIAMIGAGSQIFCKMLAMGILVTLALRDSEIRLMSPPHSKLGRMEYFLKHVISENGLRATVWSSTAHREVLKEADYVICMVQNETATVPFESDFRSRISDLMPLCLTSITILSGNSVILSISRWTRL